MHVLMSQRLQCYVAANPPAKKANKKTKKCPLKKRPGQSNQSYQKECRAIFRDAKRKAAESEAATESAFEDKTEEKPEGEWL